MRFILPAVAAATALSIGIAPAAANSQTSDHKHQPVSVRSHVSLHLSGHAVLSGNGERATVGYDGETYLEKLLERNELRVNAADGECVVRFDYPADAQGIARIGPLTCAREAAR